MTDTSGAGGDTRASRAARGDPGHRIGTVAGGYRLVEFVGARPHYEAYVGEHLHVGRKAAIEILAPGLSGDEDALAPFRRAASRASDIDHPNVCRVYDFGETEDGRRFIASELVEGRDLQDLLRTDAPMELERAVGILEQAAAGLTAAHALDIVHGSLEPTSVRVGRDGRGRDVVKVADLAVATVVAGTGSGGGRPGGGLMIGNPRYMSPEQAVGSDVDARSDIHALALIFFEMLTGGFPNDVGSTTDLMSQRLRGQSKRLAEVLPDRSFPPGLQEVLDRALARRPEDRPASAAGFARAVRAALGDAREP